MAFEEIEYVNPFISLDAVPHGGVRFRARRLSRRKSGEVTQFIQVTIGRGLAAKLHLTGDKSALRLLFGTGDDAGKIMLTVDQQRGKFVTKPLKNGTWITTINAATADGLFALDFPEFCAEPELAALPGKPTIATVQVSEAMLAVAD